MHGIKKTPSTNEYTGRFSSINENNQPQKRSESYLGRINKFFGFSQEHEQPSESAQREDSPLKSSPLSP